MANEKRLIEAHDLWSDIMMLPHNGDMISSEEVEQAIKDAPTVDAVEVVHGRWIAVEEEQPADGDVVLVYGKRGGIYTAECYRRGEYYWFHKLNSKNHHCEPTHWMPLPKPPK